MWKRIESQQDLDDLSNLVNWEDSFVLEMIGSSQTPSYFPNDINNSGHPELNYFFLIDPAHSKDFDYLEVAFIHCEFRDTEVFKNFILSGKVTPLKKVEIVNKNGESKLVCNGVLFREIKGELWPWKESYFKQADSLS